jgi:hypothetical protein
MAAQKKFEFVSVCRSSVDETLLETILSFFFMGCAQGFHSRGAPRHSPGGWPPEGRPLRQGVGVRIQIFDRSKDNFEFKVQKQSLFSYF